MNANLCFLQNLHPPPRICLIGDDIKSLFYSLVRILCKSEFIWDKGIASTAYDLKFSARFERQLSHACNSECYSVLKSHQILFGKFGRKTITIDSVILFINQQLGALC